MQTKFCWEANCIIKFLSFSVHVNLIREKRRRRRRKKKNYFIIIFSYFYDIINNFSFYFPLAILNLYQNYYIILK